MLDEHNVLTQSFRRVRDALRQPNSESLRLRISGTRVPNDRRYELPSGTDLAGLIPGDFEPDHEERDIIVNNRSTGLTRITSLNPLFDSLHFPLLFPYGNDGFHELIRYNPLYAKPTKKREYVTQNEYYNFRLQYRKNEGKTLIRSGKALQHFCIDAFTTIEQNRLLYIRLNQKQLRADLYNGLQDGHIIVPATFTGGVRYMQQLYQDAISICQFHGNPDLFITFTFQKRGLPHAHIILWLISANKPTTPAKVDEIISAEIPDPTIDPVGYDAVTKFMLHGPCGMAHQTSPCMKAGQCSKFYPKSYALETTFDDNGYVTYRRRQTGITAIKSGVILDNLSVVPYHRDLLVKYQAHMNVEICHKGQLIKYLFKYILKGPDRGQAVNGILNRPNIGKTMLTEWFTLNRTCRSAHQYTYSEVTHAFTWDTQSLQWLPRKKGFAIGRVRSIPPRAGDVFYLRMLLTKIRGPTSYEHLRTVNGVVYSNNQTACQALGLLSGDDEWNSVMAEVTQWAMPPLMRSTFVALLIFCEVSTPNALSGIAATLLPGGVTAHSRFKIPLDIDNTSTCSIKKGTALARLIRRATLIVWDEAPMVHRLSFEAVDRTICDIMDTPFEGPSYKPFGGKTVLLGGDFRQTLPIVPNAGRETNLNASLTRSYLWNHCTLLELKTNMRVNASNVNLMPVSSGLNFPEWVLAVGDGKIPPVLDQNNSVVDLIEIPKQFLLAPSPTPIADIVARVYPNFTENYQSVAYIRTRAIVTPTNQVVSNINEYVLTQIPGDAKTYLSSDTMSTTGRNQQHLELEYPTEFLNSLTFNGMPEHQLQVKPYSIVMLLRNLNPSAGLCNGTRILLTHLGEHTLRGLIIGGSHEGTIAIIPRIVLDKTDPNWPFTLKRRQYPLRLCYAMTINKSQGQTLEHIGIYLPDPVFSHGQLYVALSRARSAEGIHIMLQSDGNVSETTTRNIVYQEVFDDLRINANGS
ncbi:ATP-dependent DNA helicase PIF1 [Linum perenne]